ncbi:MAG TPA: PEGA domain-containing protein [Planctomycetota bacterium]|nr:PEGA domain-containing protein [Planctomycetota bacterium]
MSEAAKEKRSHWGMFFPLLGLAIVAIMAGWLSRMTPPRMNITSNPPGASVLINGRLMGATPISIQQIERGTYSLRIEKQGFAPYVAAIEVASQDVNVRGDLEPNGVGLLTVDIKPRGAEVLLNGEMIGYTPLKEKEVPVGHHELMVRRTNFKPQVWRIDVTTKEPVVFRGFALEDQILAMLKRQVEADKQRVANYMDLGHYLFVNDEIDEAAEWYARALQVAGTPLEFPANVDPTERQLEQRLRAEDQGRLNDEVRKKSNWPGKDVARFKKVMEAKQEEVANTNFTEWNWVQEAANNFIREEKFERAHTLLLKHIGAAPKGSTTLPQAYIALISLRLRMHSVSKAQETFDHFYSFYGNRADLGRQAANAIYSTYTTFQGDERRQVLAMAEKLLQKAVDSSKRGDPELLALCKFELANVMTFQGRAENAVSIYRESIDGTKHAETKELRRQRLADAYKASGKYADARAILTELSTSPREHIANKAKSDLRELDLLKPSPENK